MAFLKEVASAEAPAYTAGAAGATGAVVTGAVV